MRLLTISFVLLIVLLSVEHVVSKPPNIIFILADDLGYGDVQVYWNNNTHARIQTPYLDRMATEGTRWTQVYTGDTVCAPSRCVLMTGLHTGHSRIRGNSPDIPLEPGDVTIPEVLKKANYTTGIIGKWGLGENGTTGVPTKKGFDNFFGYLNQDLAHDYYPASLWQNEELFPIPGNTDGKHMVYSHDLFAERSLSFIEKHAKQPDPFFLYVAFTIPHAGGIGTTNETGEPVPSEDPYSKETWPEVERDFAAMITRMDRDIGRIFDLLVKLDIDKNTVVFFASDNGAHDEGGHDYLFFDSSGPLRGFKRSMNEGGIRTPMIVRWPDVVPAGHVDRASVWAFWDVLPTLADIAGIHKSQLPPNLDGVSRLSTIKGKSQPDPAYLYWEFCCDGDFRHAVRVADWKGIKWTLNATMQLFNLAADIGEDQNVAAANPDIVAKLSNVMLAAHTESKDYPSSPCNPGC